MLAENKQDLNLKEQQCPQCRAMVPVYEGYTTWCDKCNWNVEIMELPPVYDLFDKLFISVNQKSSQRLFEKMVQEQTLKTKLTGTKIAAFFLAGCVHLITFSFAAIGILFIAITLPSLIGLFVAVPLFLITWVLLPNLSKLSGDTIPREQYTTLYQIIDRINQALNGPNVDGVYPEIYLNAAYGQYGWKRRRILFLGLPLFAILNEREKVALLSHELAHGVNGDPSRGFFIGTAMYTLNQWYTVLYALSRNQVGIWFFSWVINLISLLLEGIVWVLGYILNYLLWQDSQRAEYLADYLAATISGTEAQLTLLDKLHLKDGFKISLTRAYLNRDGDNFFAEFQQRINRIPSREVERIRRAEKLANSRIDTTHPPTAHRVDFLKAHYVSEAKVTMTPKEQERLEQEMWPLYEAFQKNIFSIDSQSFRSLFKVSW
jgi:heat shock protein HtpX